MKCFLMGFFANNYTEQKSLNKRNEIEQLLEIKVLY